MELYLIREDVRRICSRYNPMIISNLQLIYHTVQNAISNLQLIYHTVQNAFAPPNMYVSYKQIVYHHTFYFCTLNYRKRASHNDLN